jgi:hypothetical protein
VTHFVALINLFWAGSLLLSFRHWEKAMACLHNNMARRLKNEVPNTSCNVLFSIIALIK